MFPETSSNLPSFSLAPTMNKMTKKGKFERKVKKFMDIPGVPKPTSPFIEFMLNEKNTENKQKLGYDGDIKNIGEKWNKLSEEGKAEFRKKFELKRDAYFEKKKELEKMGLIKDGVFIGEVGQKK
jgi:hypothetical protein